MIRATLIIYTQIIYTQISQMTICTSTERKLKDKNTYSPVHFVFFFTFHNILKALTSAEDRRVRGYIFACLSVLRITSG